MAELEKFRSSACLLTIEETKKQGERAKKNLRKHLIDIFMNINASFLLQDNRTPIHGQ